MGSMYKASTYYAQAADRVFSPFCSSFPIGRRMFLHYCENIQKNAKEGTERRVGGDEFAVIIEEPMNRTRMEERLQQFQKAISTILPEGKVSCSIVLV